MSRVPARRERGARPARVSGCLVYETACFEHGFIHGAEASELREGIEKIVREHGGSPECGEECVGCHIIEACQDLLDHVDARDSVARMEAQAPPKSPVAKTKVSKSEFADVCPLCSYATLLLTTNVALVCTFAAGMAYAKDPKAIGLCESHREQVGVARARLGDAHVHAGARAGGPP